MDAPRARCSVLIFVHCAERARGPVCALWLFRTACGDAFLFRSGGGREDFSNCGLRVVVAGAMTGGGLSAEMVVWVASRA